MAIPIVDAHHHIWRLAATPWLQGPAVPRIFGAYEALRRDYLIDEFAADAARAGVVKSVFVQVNVAPGDEVEEVAWVNSVVDGQGFPHAITAFADLASPDVADVLDRQVALQDAERLVADFPDTQFVLLHAGMLEDRSEAGWNLWRTGMTALAVHPNVSVKLSGLGTFLRACSEKEWRPVIERTIDLFGPSRCLFGSNFPIESLWTSYGELVDVFRGCLSRFDAGEQRAVLHDTAERLYRLGTPTM